jgi:hypothetical protein
MAFTHGKNARLWVDDLELTAFFTDFTMAAKAGQSDVTVYGLGAKSYLAGLKEGTVSGKGFFDGSSATAEDLEFVSALGRSYGQAITFIPSGVITTGTRCVVALLDLTDYGVTAPVNNVVGVTFSGQADSGLSTGVTLFNPTVTVTLVGNTSGTGENDRNLQPVASTTSGASQNLASLASNVLDVAASPASLGFASSGTIVVTTAVGSGYGPQFLTYTGISASPNSFTGVSPGVGSTNGAGTSPVSQTDYTTGGLVANLHLLTFSGTGTPGVTVTIQHSDDGNSWATLTGSWGPNGNAFTAAGSSTFTVPYGTPIARYLRAFLITTGSTVSLTTLVSAARQ